MRGNAVVALVMLCVSPAAHAASAEEVLQEFQLFGTWAVDCNAPASPANPHVSDANPTPGLVLEDHDLGAGGDINRYSILSAERLSSTRLAMDVIFRPGEPRAERQRLELVVHDGTRRTMFNQPEGKPVRVEDGAVVGFSLKTPLLRKCD